MHLFYFFSASSINLYNTMFFCFFGDRIAALTIRNITSRILKYKQIYMSFGLKLDAMHIVVVHVIYGLVKRGKKVVHLIHRKIQYCVITGQL